MIKNKFIKFAVVFSFLCNSLISVSVLAKNQTQSVKCLPNNSHILFIQVANSGQLIPDQNQPDTYSLVLNSVDPFTSYFTDRPNRVTGLLPTNQFINIWQNQGDIKKTPPNVAMETSNTKDGVRINQVFELTNPMYDAKKQQITYTARLLNAKLASSQPINIGYTVLFIDDFDWHGNKFG